VFQLKNTVTEDFIMEREQELCKKVMQELSTYPNFWILDSNAVDRIPIFSFLITYNGHLLHYNFICSLLNDLFGIQARGGKSHSSLESDCLTV
jgi:selenocysteine lyase/cysteine desulfurase